ncbi:MAG TPA: carbohydrate-binding family V/XII [Thermoanaerobaculia bacterium]|nr:carbohydrate-binding family V/XII [Thermoanaerobaculia bacterium]
MALLFSAGAVLAQSQQPPAGKPAQAGPPGQKKPAAATKRDEWPRKIPFGEFTVVIEAPQAESLEGTKLTARGTFQIERGEGADVLTGNATYVSEVQIERAQRTVTMMSTEVPKVELPGAPAARQERVAQRLAAMFTNQKPKLPLDEVLASAKMAKYRDEAPPKLNNDPPRILFESEPAILVVFDGEPRFQALEGSRLERAVNTPFLVLRDSKGACYLSGGTAWFRADDPKGPWSKAESVPTEAAQIAQKDLKEGGVSDGDIKQAASEAADKRVPKILVATEPTELIVSDGSPNWTPLVPGEIDGMANAESDVFRVKSDQQIYVLLSGRWYRSAALEGPWTYVEPDRLPASFRKIPKESSKADALSSVPGTAAAAEALADASKPRTAAIKRSDARAAATYDGEPKFESIAGTKVEYAVNTPDQVLKIRGAYYLCDQGVWFTAGSPTGPWKVTDSIPEDDIQAIPPESPVYNTRYAYVYDSTPEVVYTAYTPAYVGSYPYYGTVVFGTGWFYRPWWGAYYYPRPWTWGFHARYAPWVGWGYGFGWSPAWAGFRYGFGWGWGARWCGPAGFYRPAWRNVNVTRNVNVNRSVNITRNVYNSGANRTRTVASRSTSTAAAASRQSASRTATAQKTQSARGTANKGQAGKGGVHAQGAKPGGAKGTGGHAGGHGGGHGKK